MANDEGSRPPDAVDSRDEEEGRFDLVITAVREGQALPGHSSGPGQKADWTVLDCRPIADPAVTFHIALRGYWEGAEEVRGWGTAALYAADREAGSRLVDLLAGAFRVEVPRVRLPEQPLEPLITATVILGGGLVHTAESGFVVDGDPGAGPFDVQADGPPPGGDASGWVATKWTPERDGHYARVFFNYDLHSGRAEFLEKDPDDREALLAIFASALRDGPRPARTPETDPT